MKDGPSCLEKIYVESYSTLPPYLKERKSVQDNNQYNTVALQAKYLLPLLI